MTLTLYSAWRATAPYRVRIGLALKGVAYDYVPVDLLAGQQHQAAYRAVNPQRLTPALVLEDGEVLTQSLAILEWLDETYPGPALLPADPLARARVRAMADVVACDIHPLNNARVCRALEAMVASPVRRFSYGDQPTLADCTLIPQVYSARRFEVDLAPYPAIRAVAEAAAEHPAFQAAHPDRQPDAKPV